MKIKTRSKPQENEIKKDKIIEAFSAIKPGIAKNEIVDQSSNFIFADKNIISYNDHICVSYPFNTGLHCCVNADKFFKLAQGLPDEPFSITLKENQLLVKSKSVRLTMNAIENDEIMVYIKDLMKDMNKTSWKALPDNFSEAVSLCLFSTAKDISYGAFMAVNVDHNHVYSSDNLRISKFKLSKNIKDNFLIPLSVAVELIKFEFVEYSQSERWIHLRTNNDVIFNFRKYIEEFPSIDKFFDVKGIKIDLPKNLLAIIKNISVFSEGMDEINKIILLKFTKNKLICRGEDQSGWIERDSKIEYNGKEFEIYVHPIFFQQALAEELFDIVLGDNQILFESNNFKHVMMLPVKD